MMEEEEMKQDLEKFKNFLKITSDYLEHYQRSRESCKGTDAVNFIFSISHPATGSMVQVCHTSASGVMTMLKENKFPALMLTAEEIEALLAADLPEALKNKVEEVKKNVA